MSQFKTIEDVWGFLKKIPMFQSAGVAACNFSLNNIRLFCERLGNPHQQFPSIHVAGTNGKGTTCYLLEQIYAKAGFKTGLFTSPHLLRYNERVRVSQQEISDEALLEFFQTADPIFDDIKLSYFEISTALAFWYFAKQQVDVAIIEAGLGGRLDSTNIITPEISVITSIGLDHQAVLGETREEIASEKAGIIKKHRPVVLGNIDELSENVIRKKAHSLSSECYYATDLEPVWKGSGLIQFQKNQQRFQTTFKEGVNKWNVAMCALVVDLLQKKFEIPGDQFTKAVETFPGAPARFEQLHPSYHWFFSGSHNQQALESSLQALEEQSPKENWTCIFSSLRDKWNDEFLHFYTGFKDCYFVEQEGDRALTFSEIADIMPVKQLDETNKQIILKELKTELVIFMGSFYFYPIAKRWTANVS